MSYKDEEKLGVLNKLTKSDDYTNEGYKYIKDQNNTQEIEKEAVFLGLFCIKDPVKANVKESIIKAQ